MEFTYTVIAILERSMPVPFPQFGFFLLSMFYVKKKHFLIKIS